MTATPKMRDALATGADSALIERLMSEGDFIARYGGDELAVILDLSDLKDQSLVQLNSAARQRAQEMVISMQEPVAIGEISIAISLSIGITIDHGYYRIGMHFHRMHSSVNKIMIKRGIGAFGDPGEYVVQIEA